VVERVVYVDREPTSQMPTPTPPLTPAPLPMPVEPAPATSPPAAPETPVALSPADPGDMAAWLELRNNVLTGGLGLLPDPGHQSSGRAGVGQPVPLRGLFLGPW
jgi:hypothetical protein